MAEFGLAASIVGVISLGIQIGQGLKLYIDSASNARPRIRAIATDIRLAVQVLSELNKTIDDPISKSIISVSAQLTAAEAVLQFQNVLEQIDRALPKPGKSGVKAYQRLKWPFTESRVNLWRADLEISKATMQLLMIVLVFAAGKKQYVNVASLGQYEKSVRESQRRQREAKAAAKIAALEYLQEQDRLGRPDFTNETHSDRLHADCLAEINHSRTTSDTEYSSSGHDTNDSGTSSDYEDIKEALLSDYDICLGRLKAMQTTIEGALRKLNSTSPSHATARARHGIVKQVDETGRNMLFCLREHVVNSISHRKVMRRGEYNSSRKSTRTTTSSPSRSLRTAQPAMEDDQFMDALEDQSEELEHDHLRHLDSVEGQGDIEYQQDFEHRRAAKAAADAEASFKLRLEIPQRKEQERERETYDDFSRKQREKEEEEEETEHRKAPRKQKEEAKEKENQFFLRKQKAKADAEEEAKAKEQARIDSTMRMRLEKLGWSNHDIEIALDPGKAEKEREKQKKKKKHRYSGSRDGQFDGEIIMVPPSLPEAPGVSVGFPQLAHVPMYPRTRVQRLGEGMFYGEARRYAPPSPELPYLLPQYLVRQVLDEGCYRYAPPPPAPPFSRVQDSDGQMLAGKVVDTRLLQYSAETNREHGEEAVASEARVSSNYRKNYVTARPSQGEGRQKIETEAEADGRLSQNNPDDTAHDNVEDLVREWTNLYNEGSTTFRGKAGEQEPGPEEPNDTFAAHHAHRSTPKVLAKGTTSRSTLEYVEVTPSSWTSSSSSSSSNSRWTRLEN
ncbi:hypothetical protein E4T47_00823 [Aureobasidium subglaciale]|nr:hypothetical protein E4T47_00823 [Aureobasidium subglaciale]